MCFGPEKYASGKWFLARAVYCKVSMRRDRLSEHTRQQHPGLPIKERGQTSLTAILSRKRPHDRGYEGETNPTEKKRPMDQMKHNLVVLLLLAKSKSNRLPLKYNSQTA